MPSPPHPTPHRATLRAVRRRIMAWYRAEQRDLPFRRSRDPWPVLVGEVMLQQTQAGRIAERFDHFLGNYPTPEAMAAVPVGEVLADWSGLGYNRRALNLHRAAVAITADGWPATVTGLEGLPGIGRYSARAIAAIAFDQPVGAVDTNVRRWLVRRFDADPDDAAALQLLADRLASGGREGITAGEAGTWTHATMEFGALVCSARSPRCAECPVSRGCPSRRAPRRVPVPRQAPSTAAARAARGALLRALAASPRHRLSRDQARRSLDGMAPGPDLEPLVDALVRDGLLHRSGGDLVLGPG